MCLKKSFADYYIPLIPAAAPILGAVFGVAPSDFDLWFLPVLVEKRSPDQSSRG